MRECERRLYVGCVLFIGGCYLMGGNIAAGVAATALGIILAASSVRL
jgi:hypothetical protein